MVPSGQSQNSSHFQHSRSWGRNERNLIRIFFFARSCENMYCCFLFMWKFCLLFREELYFTENSRKYFCYNSVGHLTVVVLNIHQSKPLPPTFTVKLSTIVYLTALGFKVYVESISVSIFVTLSL